MLGKMLGVFLNRKAGVFDISLSQPPRSCQDSTIRRLDSSSADLDTVRLLEEYVKRAEISYHVTQC
jgi:hypothetical protein